MTVHLDRAGAEQLRRLLSEADLDRGLRLQPGRTAFGERVSVSAGGRVLGVIERERKPIPMIEVRRR